MNYLANIVLLISGMVLLWALLMVMLLKMRQENNRNKEEIFLLKKEINEYEDLGKPLAGYNRELQQRKDLVKDKIMRLFEKQDKISNRDVVRLLEISSATTVRYLDELEKEGRIKQVGKTGRNVFYKK